MANKILEKMLDRLYAAIASGPSLNCRPHSSRQRFDLSHLSRLGDGPAERALSELLSDGASTKINARNSEPPKAWKYQEGLSAEQRTALKAWEDQQALIKKL